MRYSECIFVQSTYRPQMNTPFVSIHVFYALRLFQVYSVSLLSQEVFYLKIIKKKQNQKLSQAIKNHQTISKELL